jgi:hypothetical protein
MVVRPAIEGWKKDGSVSSSLHWREAVRVAAMELRSTARRD